MPRVPVTLLDLALVGRDETVADGLAASLRLAQAAERLGYRRVWYAEHHNMSTIASSATAVLIGHIAAHTETIRVGSGAIMLPNHSPLVIAEQFGTLATLFPGRIDLGLGRAPGTDQQTVRSLRRDPAAADRFPHDVLELQGFLSDHSLVSQVRATPGQGTHVPLYLMGSSLFGATLAARLGLPYGFASHFAPQALDAALATYRAEFEPSAQLAEPYAFAACNVIVADTEAEAQHQLLLTRRARVRLFLGRGGRRFSDEEADLVLASPQGAMINDMMTFTAVGTPDVVASWVDGFQARTEADELVVVPQGATAEDRLRSLELFAKGYGLPAA